MAAKDNLDTLLNHYKHRGVKSGSPHAVQGASKPLELPSIQQQNVVTNKASQYIEKFPMSTPLNQYLHTRNARSPYFRGKKKRNTAKKREENPRAQIMSDNELGALLDRFLTKDTPTMEQLLKEQGGVEPRVGPPRPEDSQLDAPTSPTKNQSPTSPKSSLPALPGRPEKPQEPMSPKENVSLPSINQADMKKPPAELEEAEKGTQVNEEDDGKEGKKALKGSKWAPGDRVTFIPPDKKLPQEKGVLSKWIAPGLWAVSFEGKEEPVECKVQNLEREMEQEQVKDEEKEAKDKLNMDRMNQRNVDGTHREDYDYKLAIEDKHVAGEGAAESDLADTVELLNVNEFIQEARDTSDTLMFPTPSNSCVIFKIQHKLTGKYTPENPPEYYSKIEEADLKEFKRLSRWNEVPSLYPKYIEIKPATARFIPSICRLKDVGEDIQSAVSLNITPPEIVDVSANRYPNEMVEAAIGEDDESVYTGDALFMHPRDTQVTLDEQEVRMLSEWTKDINDLHRRCLEEMSAQNNPKSFRLLQPKLYFDKRMTRPGAEKHVKQIAASHAAPVDHMQQIAPNAQASRQPVPTGSTGGPAIQAPVARKNGGGDAKSMALTVAGPASNAGTVVPLGGQSGGMANNAGGGDGSMMGNMGMGAGGGGGMGGMAAGMNQILVNQLAFFNQVLAMQTQMSSNIAAGGGGGGAIGGARKKGVPAIAAGNSNALVVANQGGGAPAAGGGGFQDQEDNELNKQAEKDMFEEAKKRELFTKARNNRSTDVEQDFAKGTDPDTVDKHGNTVLHIACQNGHKRMIKVCLRWGANLNAQNMEGQTPLHFLFNYHYEDLGSYLISKGADDSICNNFGFSPYEGLRPDNKDDALKVLQKHKKKMDKKSSKQRREAKESKKKTKSGSAGDWFGGEK